MSHTHENDLPATTGLEARPASATNSRIRSTFLGTPRRRRTSLIAGGLAVAILAGGTLAVTTQPEIGEALGMPSASATPALSGTGLAQAQARATITTAQDVMSTANQAADTTDLQQQVAALQKFPTLDSAQLQQHIAATVKSTDDVAQASAHAQKQQADAAAAAQAAAAAAAQAAAQAAAAAAAQAAANTPAAARATAANMASSQYGWGADQFSCLNSLWNKESGWNYQAYNPSGATGIPQALPGSKMSTIAADWATNATTQIAWGLGYIKASYGTPCAAWAHSEATNYY